MRRLIVWTACSCVLLCHGTVWADGFWDQLFDRTAESAKRQAENRVNKRINQGIDKAMNKTEETIQCIATDRECLKRAKDEGKTVVLTGSPAREDTVKCLGPILTV